jgi:hypothetical protein
MRSQALRFTVERAHDPESPAVWIMDDDFGYDAMLKVGGDFATITEKLAFAQAIADVLNQAEHRIPICPSVNSPENI